MNSRFRSFSPGFTLLEVLIALVIIAVALAAATHASQIATDSTFTVKKRLIGGWIAENRLAELRTSPKWPDIGVMSQAVEQANLPFTWQQTVSTTPNADFRRVEVKVFADKNMDYAIATLTGYLKNEE